MRRSDREITDPAAIDQIIRSCDCCRLGLSTESAPYIVPLNFGYTRENGIPTFYFHGAAEGRKLELIQRDPRVGFELDTNHALKTANAACGYSFQFQSVIGSGTVSILETPAEKMHGLQYIMEHFTGKSDWNIPEQALSSITVLRLSAAEMTCKEHP